MPDRHGAASPLNGCGQGQRLAGGDWIRRRSQACCRGLSAHRYRNCGRGAGEEACIARVLGRQAIVPGSQRRGGQRGNAGGIEGSRSQQRGAVHEADRAGRRGAATPLNGRGQGQRLAGGDWIRRRSQACRRGLSAHRHRNCGRSAGEEARIARILGRQAIGSGSQRRGGQRGHAGGIQGSRSQQRGAVQEADRARRRGAAAPFTVAVRVRVWPAADWIRRRNQACRRGLSARRHRHRYDSRCAGREARIACVLGRQAIGSGCQRRGGERGHAGGIQGCRLPPAWTRSGN